MGRENASNYEMIFIQSCIDANIINIKTFTVFSLYKNKTIFLYCVKIAELWKKIVVDL